MLDEAIEQCTNDSSIKMLTLEDGTEAYSLANKPFYPTSLHKKSLLEFVGFVFPRDEELEPEYDCLHTV
jgi:hypothetical protein